MPPSSTLRSLCCESLPRLAWCARMDRGAGEVAVRHGPWVESHDGWFFEGAWSGPFADGRFDRAHAVMGSGGRSSGEGVVFVGPSHYLERLYSVRSGSRLWVSNSLAFVLAESGEALDPEYPHYVADLANQLRRHPREEKWLRTCSGDRRLRVHYMESLLVTPDLEVRTRELPVAPAPRSYAEHVAALEGGIGAILRNAADPLRLRRYRPVAQISQGYDSPAAAALARKLGCSEAVTFTTVDPHDGSTRDGGGEIARHLGMEITEYSAAGFHDLPGPLDAEFCAGATGSDLPLAAMEPQLEGAVLVTGRGARVWSFQRRDCLRDLRIVGWDNWATLAGCSQTEFRLRVGFSSLHPAMLALHHAPALYAISRSREMERWSLPQEYNRPIPRRIVEEAGVPRECFGTRKMGGSFHDVRKFGLSAAAGEDLRKFYDAVRVAEANSSERFQRFMAWLERKNRRLVRRLNDRLPISSPIVPRTIVSARHDRPPREFAYTFNWGVDRTMDRYREAGTGLRLPVVEKSSPT